MSFRRAPTGGLIDRSRPLRFTFDGRSFTGFAGDTLASALLASGVRILGRSFKYHRPRGVWGAWVDEPNAILSVRLGDLELPNCLATTTPLEDGMEARAVNAWPSAGHDLKGGLDLFHRWLAAGFYYKTFIWPDWHLFEPSIRRMAGLGAVSRDVPEGYVSEQIHDACDTLVIGGGAAGLAAARAAAEAGQGVVLVDDHPEIGGGLHQLGTVEGMAPEDWIAAERDAIRAAGGRILTRTTAFGVYDHGLIGLVEAGRFGTAPRLRRMRAGRVVLASGALDRPMTFAGNDKPGIVSLFGAAEYHARYGLVPHGDVVALTNHGLATDAVARLGVAPIWLDPAAGDLRATGARRLAAIRQGDRTHPADVALVSGGLTPLVHLWRHAGGKLDWCADRQAFLPGAAPEGFCAVGAANGTYTLAAALEEARAAGQGRPIGRRSATHPVTPLWPKPGARGRQWIDLQHDVTLKDIELAARENYVSVEHLKRYTTLGMASDQGKTSNMAGLAAMAEIRGVSIPEVGTTTFRPPFVPIQIEGYHGAHRETLNHPLKRLALEPAHRAAGAALGEYGGWLRPGWYGSGIPGDHIAAETRMAREAAGVLDASPLGKILVMGPDADAFVNFVFYNTMATLKPGAIRYGFLLTETGIVMDDGVVARLGPDRFLISCSSGHVDAVRRHLESWRQDGNDPARIFIHDLTQAMATVTVTGPSARRIVTDLGTGVDLTAGAFPHMTLREGRFQDAALRISRVSFTGDVSFELSVRAGLAADLWDAVIAQATQHGGGAIGIEALSILRAEKGYIMVGKDTDGETMPQDLGFGIPRRKKSAAFVGDRSLHSAKACLADRKVLVGLRVEAGAAPLPTGAHIVTEGTAPTSLGFVTSSYDSSALGRPVALALLASGGDRIGEDVAVWHDGRLRRATVTAPCAFDPEGARLHA